MNELAQKLHDLDQYGEAWSEANKLPESPLNSERVADAAGKQAGRVKDVGGPMTPDRHTVDLLRQYAEGFKLQGNLAGCHFLTILADFIEVQYVQIH